ncbi:MAG TPA: hypothetical protein VHD82_14750 [Amycolatopsis sp.]|nr:hypothetical protein [Amycolatopsis sp.]HVV10515.1 hypothetical protein [Amycolatopsis sp.]
MPSRPAPVQLPHPPVWIGGNGRNARRRAARAAQGWSPLLIDERFAATTRTAALCTPDDLAAAVSDLRELTEAEGRDPAALDVQVQSRHSDVLIDGGSLDEHRNHLGEIAGAGASWFVVRVPGSSLSEATEALARYGREVLGGPR